MTNKPLQNTSGETDFQDTFVTMTWREFDTAIENARQQGIDQAYKFGLSNGKSEKFFEVGKLYFGEGDGVETNQSRLCQPIEVEGQELLF